jgi:hypothetical protein
MDELRGVMIVCCVGCVARLGHGCLKVRHPFTA